MPKHGNPQNSKLDGRPHKSGIVGHGRAQSGSAPKPPQVKVHMTGHAKKGK